MRSDPCSQYWKQTKQKKVEEKVANRAERIANRDAFKDWEYRQAQTKNLTFENLTHNV